MNNLKELVNTFLNMASIENAKDRFCKFYTGKDPIESGMENCKAFFTLACPGCKVKRLELTSNSWFSFTYDIEIVSDTERFVEKGECTLTTVIKDLEEKKK